MQGDLGHFQESVGNLEVERKCQTVQVQRKQTGEQTLGAALRLPSSQSPPDEMKTCSAILQTVRLMKGSLPLCSPSTYNAFNSAIISVHLRASLISRSRFLQPTPVATGEPSSQGSYSTLLGSANLESINREAVTHQGKSSESEHQIYSSGAIGVYLGGFDSHWFKQRGYL